MRYYFLQMHSMDVNPFLNQNGTFLGYKDPDWSQVPEGKVLACQTSPRWYYWQAAIIYTPTVQRAYVQDCGKRNRAWYLLDKEVAKANSDWHGLNLF